MFVYTMQYFGNDNKKWSRADKQMFPKLLEHGKSDLDIAITMHRKEAAIAVAIGHHIASLYKAGMRPEEIAATIHRDQSVVDAAIDKNVIYDRVPIKADRGDSASLCEKINVLTLLVDGLAAKIDALEAALRHLTDDAVPIGHTPLTVSD